MIHFYEIIYDTSMKRFYDIITYKRFYDTYTKKVFSGYNYEKIL